MKIEFLDEVFNINPNFVIVDYIGDRNYDTNEDEQDFLRLVSSIKENGLINPIILAPTDDEAKPYELICGRRRLKAIREICKQTNESFKTPCRILPKGTTRVVKNIIAYDDNKNRKDLDDSVKLFPLYLLVANSFYGLDNNAKTIKEINDNRLYLFLNNIFKGNSIENPQTFEFIKKLANDIKMDERNFIKKLLEMSSIDANFAKIKQLIVVETKELLKYKKHDNQEVKKLLDECFLIIQDLNKARKSLDFDLLREINHEVKNKFDIIPLSEEDLADNSKFKEFLTIISKRYLKEIKALISQSKPKANPKLKTLKSYLKDINDDELEKILQFIEEMRHG